MIKFNALLIAAFAALAVGAPIANAAHNGNNFAEPDASGKAIVNYSEGRGDFNGTITVRNLDPNATYSFFVRRMGVEQLVCTDAANSQGTFTCQAQHLKLNGFAMAVVRSSAGIEVASGTFERRGNCRDPQQAMSQCTAPGQNK
jgi:hypothetical protein